MIKINPKDIRPNTVDYEEFGFLDGVRSSIQTQIDIALLPDGTIPLSAKWSTAFNIIVNKNGGEITADEGDFTNTYLNCFQLATNSVFGNGFLNLISIEEYDSTDVFYFLLDNVLENYFIFFLKMDNKKGKYTKYKMESKNK